MSIYQEEILAHYHDPQNFGRLHKPTKTSDLSNPLCGDTITMDILLQDNKVTDCKYEAKGCAISIASASLLSEYCKGKSKEELLRLDKNFIIGLLGIDLSPNRLKCALLPLEALHTTLI
jgi:nitrogen fixation NifU-like protein